MRSTLEPLSARAARLRARAADERGATAVEFALVATPFFVMVCGIIELAMIFMVSVSLENSTITLARTIRTGEMQSAGGANANTFRDTICDNMGWLQVDCKTKLRVDVNKFTSFSGTNGQGAPITNGEWNTTPNAFNCGGPGDIVLVRAYYEWPLFAPGFDIALQKLNGGKTVIGAVTTFRNEPYGGAVTC